MSGCATLDLAELLRHPLPPVVEGGKNDRGQLLLVGGTRDIPGSALITATAAFRAGAGKVTVATVESVAPTLGLFVPEIMVVGLPEDQDGGFAHSSVATIVDLAERSDATVAGPGMLPSEFATALAARLCAIDRPRAFDAALLLGLAPAAEAARRAATDSILLPHAGEMASLIGCSEDEAETNALECGRLAAERYDSIVLAKGAESHIVTPDGSAWRYQGGGPGLGVSGSGDSLAGILGGLLARGAKPLTGLLWAVWLHGEAGRSLSQKIGPFGFLAREIADVVPQLLAGLQPSDE